MAHERQIKPPDNAERFVQQAQQTSPGMLHEYWNFLRHSKKWWIIPTVAVLLLLGVLVALSASGLAPFIYALW